MECVASTEWLESPKTLYLLGGLVAFRLRIKLFSFYFFSLFLHYTHLRVLTSTQELLGVTCINKLIELIDVFVDCTTLSSFFILFFSLLNSHSIRRKPQMYITMDRIVRIKANVGLLFSATISIHLLNDLITLSKRLCCEVSALYEIPTPQDWIFCQISCIIFFGDHQRLLSFYL